MVLLCAVVEVPVVVLVAPGEDATPPLPPGVDEVGGGSPALPRLAALARSLLPAWADKLVVVVVVPEPPLLLAVWDAWFDEPFVGEGGPDQRLFAWYLD